MRVLSIELEAETVDALEAERELFGFESRQAYVRWIIERRGSIEADHERGRDENVDRLLADHSERIARLEERVVALSRALEGDGERRSTDETAGTDGRDGECDEPRGEERDQPADEPTAANREPGLEVRGSPRTVRHGPESRAERGPTGDESVDSSSDAGSDSNPDGDASPSSGSNSSAASSASTGKTADTTGSAARGNQTSNSGANEDSGAVTGSASRSESAAAPSTTEPESGDSAALSPERVARIPEDPVLEDAGVLGNVEAERLDELSRRAVASTRKRLNRDVQTGLEYTSSTRLAGDGVRPGEDVADLDALSIPGRSAETVEKRRRAVGRALAYLRDEGRARRSDFVDALYAECPAGYETADGWWRCIKMGLKQVDAVDGGEGSRVWRVTD